MALVIKTTGIEDYLDGGEAYVKALIAGPPSAGKTRSASYWPKPIYADCEKGRMSLADRAMPYGEILSTDDMMTLLRNLQIECMKPVASRKYQTLVIDTIDAYQRIVIQERLTSERKEAFSGYGDWGYLDAKMTQLISKLLALPMNIVVNMHVKEKKDGDDGPLVIEPKLKGDIREQIAAEFDLVGLMGVSWVAEGGERVLQRAIQWHPEPRSPWLKDRSGRLPKYTPVAFTEEDYTGLFLPLSAALDELAESTDLEVMQSEADGAPEPVQPGSKEQAGGAVAQPQAVAPAPAKKAPAKKAAAAVPAAAKPVPAAPRPTMEVEGLPVGGAESAPVPVAAGATTPVDGGKVDEKSGVVEVTYVQPSGAATEEQALATVTSVLGGTVEPTPDEEPPLDNEAGASQGDEPMPAEPVVAVVPPAATAPMCGAPGKTAKGDLNTDPISGCGKDLAEENRDVVNIGFIRTTREGRPTYLCAACIAAHKASKAS
jgi:hypothetical protein